MDVPQPGYQTPGPSTTGDHQVPGSPSVAPLRRSESSLTPPPRTPSPEPYPLDQTTGVIGVQVDSSAETVQWFSGQKTILPYAEVQGDDGPLNELQVDKKYVEDLARCPESLPPSDLVTYLSKGENPAELVTAARRALSENKTVVVREFVDTHGFEFTESGMYNEFSCLPDRALKAHGG